MGPCLDLTLATIPIVQARGLDAILVMEELINPVYDSKNPNLHFAIEVVDDTGKKSFLDYEAINQVRIGRGNYFNEREDVQPVDVQRFDASGISPSENIWSILGAESSVQLKSGIFDFRRLLEQLTQNNTYQTLRRYLQACGGNPNLKFRYVASA
jgi:hypothetical protein